MIIELLIFAMWVFVWLGLADAGDSNIIIESLFKCSLGLHSEVASGVITVFSWKYPY